MQFGPVPVAAALGGILAHSLRTADDASRKAACCQRADIEVLEQAGYREITVAQLDADDIAEDEAAARIAAAFAGHAVCEPARRSPAAPISMPKRTASPASMPRASKLLNAVDEVDHAGDHRALRASSSRARCSPPSRSFPLRRPPSRRSGRATAWRAEQPCASRLSLTNRPRSSPRHSPTPVQLSSTRIAARWMRALSRLARAIVLERRVRHDTRERRECDRRGARCGADPILIFGASAITDRRDVVPAAIVEAGGEIDAFRHARRSRQPSAARANSAARPSSACPAAPARPS